MRHRIAGLAGNAADNTGAAAVERRVPRADALVALADLVGAALGVGGAGNAGIAGQQAVGSVAAAVAVRGALNTVPRRGALGCGPSARSARGVAGTVGVGADTRVALADFVAGTVGVAEALNT